MSYVDKLGQIVGLVDQFNEAVPESERLDAERIKSSLRKAGVISEDTLRAASFEDFENAGIPRVLARRAAEIARETKPGEKRYVSSKQAERMSERELLEAYDPNETIDSPVTTRLKTISKGKRCLVFDPDGSVNVGVSSALIRELALGYAERELYEVGTPHPRPVYRIGDRTQVISDENPIYIGEPLRPDGTCQRTNIDWSLVPLDVRQLVYLVVLDSVKGSASVDPHQLNEWAVDGKLRKRYPKQVLRLAELIQTGKAPSLKVTLKKGSSGKNDPFYQTK